MANGLSTAKDFGYNAYKNGTKIIAHDGKFLDWLRNEEKVTQVGESLPYFYAWRDGFYKRADEVFKEIMESNPE